MKSQLLLALVASAALAGCAGAGPSKPIGAVMGAWTAPAATEAVSMDWWMSLNDPALDALVRKALSRNADIRAASANLEAAHALTGEARASLAPSGEANASLTRGRVAGLAQPPIPGTPDRLPSQTLASVGASLGWELDLFGRLRANLQGARANTEEALWLQRQAQAAVVAGVVGAYAEHGYSARAASLAAERAQALSVQLATAEKAGAAGAASIADVERYRLALAQARAEIGPLKAEQANAARRLAVLTGETPRPTVDGVRLLYPPDRVQAGSPAELLRRRPDVAAAEQRWAAAAAAAKVAAADLYPRVSLRGDVGLSAKPDRLGDAGALSFGVGPALSWGVFDLPRLRARVAAADAGADAALARWEGVVLSALREADASLETFSQARASARRFEEASDASARVFAAAEARRAAGAVSPAALEAARVEHLNAQATANDANARAVQAWIAAQLALGAGWNSDAPDARAARSL
jgi:NodT family efflux transporter outer membrane factor (OMF) lipoprotein